MSEFRIAFPNWYAVGGNANPNGTERGTGGEIIVFASVEHPSNAFTRVTWQGAASASAADGETILSDPIRISIPKGSKFFVRFFASGAVGVKTCEVLALSIVAADVFGSPNGKGRPDQTERPILLIYPLSRTVRE